eukprot:596996-Rhodomonas_salina.2
MLRGRSAAQLAQHLSPLLSLPTHPEHCRIVRFQTVHCHTAPARLLHPPSLLTSPHLSSFSPPPVLSVPLIHVLPFRPSSAPSSWSSFALPKP